MKNLFWVLLLLLVACRHQQLPPPRYAQEVTLELSGVLESPQGSLPVQGVVVLAAVQQKLILSLLPAPSLGECNFIPDLQCIATSYSLEQPLYLLGKAVRILLASWANNKAQPAVGKIVFSSDQFFVKDMSFPRQMCYRDGQITIHLTITGSL